MPTGPEPVGLHTFESWASQHACTSNFLHYHYVQGIQDETIEAYFRLSIWSIIYFH
jgi:hypothetical protein